MHVLKYNGSPIRSPEMTSIRYEHMVAENSPEQKQPDANATISADAPFKEFALSNKHVKLLFHSLIGHRYS